MDQVERMFEEEARLFGDFFGGRDGFGDFRPSFSESRSFHREESEWDPYEKKWRKK